MEQACTFDSLLLAIVCLSFGEDESECHKTTTHVVSTLYALWTRVRFSPSPPFYFQSLVIMRIAGLFYFKNSRDDSALNLFIIVKTILFVKDGFFIAQGNELFRVNT